MGIPLSFTNVSSFSSHGCNDTAHERTISSVFFSFGDASVWGLVILSLAFARVSRLCGQQAVLSRGRCSEHDSTEMDLDDGLCVHSYLTLTIFTLEHLH